MYLDSNGLITQSSGDGGDKLQREGFWYAGMFLNPSYTPIPGMASYSQALQILTYDSEGDLERDEIQYTEALDPNDVSRDQLSPNVVACGFYKYDDRINRIIDDVIGNFSQYPNGDIAFIPDYSRFARALEYWFLYPLIFLFDLYMIGTSLFRVILSYFDTTNQYVGDDINFICDLAQAQYVLPTPFSFIARKLFKLRRNGPMYGMEVYFAPSTGANPEFISLWQPIVEGF